MATKLANDINGVKNRLAIEESESKAKETI